MHHCQNPSESTSLIFFMWCVSSIANADGTQFTCHHQHNHNHHYHHHHTQRPLRSHHYSYCDDGANHHQPIPTQLSRLSFYSRNSSRPESLALDVTSVDIRMQTMSLPLQPSSRVSSFRRESKTAQTLSIVVGGFVACWLPFFIIYLLTPFFQIPPMLMSLLTWLGKSLLLSSKTFWNWIANFHANEHTKIFLSNKQTY